MMKKLIVTADDYGMSLAVNKAIVEGIQSGMITTTNVMTNMEFLDNRQELADLRDKASIGLHWNISVGKPLSPKDKISSLVDSETGEFLGYAKFCEKYKSGQIKNEEIVTELKAQYNKFVELFGFEPDYWNTHQNTHVALKIYDVFLNLASELKICKMRNHQRIYVPAKLQNGYSLKWRVMEPVKRCIINNWQSNASKKGMKYPEGIIVSLNESDRSDMEYTFSNIRWGKNEVGEFVIHPATECDSPYFGKIIEKRIEEYKQFTSNSTREVIRKNNIVLVDFSEI